MPPLSRKRNIIHFLFELAPNFFRLSFDHYHPRMGQKVHQAGQIVQWTKTFDETAIRVLRRSWAPVLNE